MLDSVPQYRVKRFSLRTSIPGAAGRGAQEVTGPPGATRDETSPGMAPDKDNVDARRGM